MCKETIHIFLLNTAGKWTDELEIFNFEFAALRNNTYPVLNNACLLFGPSIQGYKKVAKYQ